MSDRTYEELMAAVAAGTAEVVTHEVEGIRFKGRKNVHWLSDPDPKGRREVRDAYMTVRVDSNGIPWATPKKNWAEQAGATLRMGAVGVLKLLDSPLAHLLEIHTGRSLAVLRNIVQATALQGTEDQILRLIQVIGRGRLRAVAATIEKARADGVITPLEWAGILSVAQGKG